MTDSTNKPSEEPKELPKKQLLRQQGDLVIQGYKDLADKTGSFLDKHDERYRASVSRTLASVQNAVSIDQPQLKKRLLVKLQSSLLPQLQQQIITTLRLTNPYDLTKDPGSQFKCILEVQAELNPILDQIFSTTDVLCPEPLPSPSIRTNDQYLKELKPFRIYGLYHHLMAFFLEQIHHVFSESSDLIQQLKLATKKYQGKVDLASARDYLNEEGDHCLELIESAINWLEGSEFDVVQIDWRNEKRGIDEQLQELLGMINPTTPLNEENNPSGTQPLSEPVVNLAKSVLPVIKLCRLFFNKLSERGMNRKRLPLFTTMCSYQLDLISRLAEEIDGNLGRILKILRAADTIVDENTTESLTKTVKALETHFETPLLLILLHFLPIIPDTVGNPVQNYFKEWFAIWNTQFTLAIKNLLDAIESYEGNFE
ncbi:hypothetical protein PGT21_004142 [Puccinia graminis f. sp. tritici]|uniref:Uncharacterized protein n=1 Tax=Puccinia graminis f. sp. tritici TaxID=56615 RepID=A0A5B0LPW1_PUCGR|nr:hypothetical protein PGT21_004142 [Puccinia graminis f. sp. tritici]KAA1079998.1 hypothetical protein PGTUg99_020192 [Puccinia graminis f. sp. tritici]